MYFYSRSYSILDYFIKLGFALESYDLIIISDTVHVNLTNDNNYNNLRFDLVFRHLTDKANNISHILIDG